MVKLVYAVMLFSVLGMGIVFTIINKNLIASPKGIPPFLQIEQDGKLYNAKVNVLDTFVLKTELADQMKMDAVSKSKILFHQNPVFLIWSLVILFMTAIVCGGFPVFLAQDKEIISSAHLTKQQVLTSSFLTLMVISLMAFITKMASGLFTADEIIERFNILLHHGKNIIDGIVYGIFLLLIPCILFVFMILPAASNSTATSTGKLQIEMAAGRLNALQEKLLNSLQFLAAVVILAGLTTSLLGNAIKATIRIEGFDIFPLELSYAYGLQFSLFLGILYIPVNLYINQQKSVLKARLGPHNADWKKEVAETLVTNASVLDTLRGTLTVLSPLIASFLPEHLNIFN